MLFRYRRSHIYLYLIYHISAEIMHRDPELVRSNGVQGVTKITRKMLNIFPNNF